MAKLIPGSRARFLLACCALLTAVPAVAQTAGEGKNLGAMSRENLDKPRPAAPVDLTGTYNFKFALPGDPASLRNSTSSPNGSPFTAYLFTPGPKLTPKAQAELDKYEDYKKKGMEYRDDPAACWPLGMPRIMTRYWPIQIVQLPTEILLINMFYNNVRWIYTDGRQHPADDDLVLTYNGHSIGHWEGSTLVVDTVGLTADHHWIQEGIPTGEKLHIVERIRKTPDGIWDDFTMTDPDNWVGEWKSSKFYDRDDHADIEEHTCIYEQMSKMPGFEKNIRE